MTTTDTTNEAAPKKNGKRTRVLIWVSVILLIALIAYVIWWAMFARHYESTDDAYAAGNVVQVTSQVGGTVVAIHADDTERVTAGQPLVELDRRDAEVALDQAKAQLAQAVREARTLFVNNAALNANVALRSADVERARADFDRRKELRGTGAVSQEEIGHAQVALRSAESALQAAREQLASNRALTAGTTVEQHPSVRRAAAQVEAAYLALMRTTLPAPITGYVAKRSVQVGQRIAAGTPLLSVVPLDNLWVDANFKEVQIARMRIGQPVALHSDLYGGDIEYHGKVVGLAPGTGAAFALLPPQNASGNWIKVVQRVPVRIALDPQELAQHPLRVGVSMKAQVNISNSQGTSLTEGSAQRALPVYTTTVFDKSGQEAHALIERIIAENSDTDGNGNRGNRAPTPPAGKRR